jgi:hypothetical protein
MITTFNTYAIERGLVICGKEYMVENIEMNHLISSKAIHVTQ